MIPSKETRSSGIRFDADRELRVRMVLALALVVVLPFVYLYLFAFLANIVGVGVPTDPLVIGGVVLVGLALQYRFGPRAVLDSVGAERATAEEYPALHASVTRLAAHVDTPKPEVDVIDTDLPNSFAVAGGDRAIVVTTGLLERLDDEEIEAVLAHELAHLKNRDASLMTVAWLLPTISYAVTKAAFFVLYAALAALVHAAFVLLHNDVEAHRDQEGDDATASAAFVAYALVWVTVFAWFWIGSVLVYRVLSRHREYAADRAAATITGSPAALAAALERIDETLSLVPDEDRRRYDGGAEVLYLVPIESRSFDSDEFLGTDIFPDSHPPTRERIDRLRELTRERR